MGIEVYTIMPAPFRMGGTLEDYLKTEIEEYKRVDIGAGYFGILFHNPHTDNWHMALEACGALIGTNKSKAKLIKQVKGDVESGTPEIFEKQIEMGKSQMRQAQRTSSEDWFSRFRKDEK